MQNYTNGMLGDSTFILFLYFKNIKSQNMNHAKYNLLQTSM